MKKSNQEGKVAVMRKPSHFRFYVLGLIVLLIFTLTGTSVTHAEDSNYTPADYRSYLESLIDEGDLGATNILSQFNALEEKEQTAFVEFLYSPEYLDSFSSGIIASFENDQTHNYTKTVVLNDVEIPIEVKLESVDSANNPSIMAISMLETPANVPLTIFGIQTSALSTILISETDGSIATRSLEVRQQHVNYNPALWITEVSTNTPGYVAADNYAYGRGTFNVASTGSVGQISSTWHVEVKTSNASHAYGKFTTTHPNPGSAAGIWYPL
jgi:hypothetical protein